MIDILKAPIIETGQSLGDEVVEDSNLVGRPIRACCTFMLGSEYLRDMRLDLYVNVKWRKMDNDISSLFVATITIH